MRGIVYGVSARARSGEGGAHVGLRVGARCRNYKLAAAAAAAAAACDTPARREGLVF